MIIIWKVVYQQQHCGKLEIYNNNNMFSSTSNHNYCLGDLRKEAVDLLTGSGQNLIASNGMEMVDLNM